MERKPHSKQDLQPYTHKDLLLFGIRDGSALAAALYVTLLYKSIPVAVMLGTSVSLLIGYKMDEIKERSKITKGK